MFSYSHPRPALTADAVVLRDGAIGKEVLLVQRRYEPYAGMWALPGGFVDEYESPAEAARRELAEEAGLCDVGTLYLVGVFAKKGRDPRGWTVSCAYRANVGLDQPVRAGDDAADARWYALSELPPIAFDHNEIIGEAVAADTKS